MPQNRENLKVQYQADTSANLEKNGSSLSKLMVPNIRKYKEVALHSKALIGRGEKFWKPVTPQKPNPKL